MRRVFSEYVKMKYVGLFSIFRQQRVRNRRVFILFRRVTNLLTFVSTSVKSLFVEHPKSKHNIYPLSDSGSQQKQKKEEHRYNPHFFSSLGTTSVGTCLNQLRKIGLHRPHKLPDCLLFVLPC